MEQIAVSIRGAAELTQLSEDTIRAAVHAGELPASRIGRAIRIEPSELRTWIASKADPVPTKS